MTTDIQLLRSSVANKRPDSLSLLDGQPAVNMNSQSPGLFFKMTDGDLAKIGPATITTDGTTPNSAPMGSVGNSIAEEWWDARSVFASPILKMYQSDVLGWKSAHGFEIDDTTGDQALDRKVTLRTMVANGTGVASYIQVPAGPASDQLLIGDLGMIRVETDELYLNWNDGNQWWALQNRNDDALFTGLIVTGDTTLGDDCTDRLDIVSTATAACDFTLLAASPGLFFEAAGSGSNRLGFTVPQILTDSETVFVLPDGDGAPENIIVTDGSANLSWMSRDVIPDSVGSIDTQVFFDDGGLMRTTPFLRINKTVPSISVDAPILPDSSTGSRLGGTGQTFEELHTSRLTVTPTLIEVREDVLPDLNATHDLGSAALAFSELHTTSLTSTPTQIEVREDVLPDVDDTHDLGSAALAFSELHTSSLTVLTNGIEVREHVLPDADNLIDLGSPALRYRNIYTGDLHLRNTRGDWTMIEEETYLSLRNNQNGKIYRINMTEV